MQNYKKPLIVGISIAAAAFIALFIKNYVQQTMFKPILRDNFIQLYKKLKKLNYLSLKQIALVAAQISAQFKQIPPQAIRGYIEGPQSPVKIDEMFQKNISKLCQTYKITVSQFQFNLKHYKQIDAQLQQLIQQSERQFQTALTGRIPNIPVKIPEFLTKEKIIQIQSKIVKQKYLFQIGIFRKLRKYTKQQIAQNPELAKDLPNPETEQQMLEEQGLGADDQPASAVLHAAILKYRTDESFKQALQSIENSFKNIYSRYQAKILNNKITETQLTELEDEIIYFQYV